MNGCVFASRPVHGTVRHNLVVFPPMFRHVDPNTPPPVSFTWLDKAVFSYLCLPLVIFLAGWFKWWAALPLLACTAYALRPLIAKTPAGAGFAVTPLQIGIAVVVGSVWSVLGGTDHLFFTNSDWHVRDAVLHDLVASPWPVGYGLLNGYESLLRAPVAYFLPAALIGKAAGLPAAHVAMLLWTALGATLFLLQVLSLTRSRLGIAVAVVAVVVLFSGLDIVGSLLNDGPRFRSDWNITTHLEWWAGTYQYSSITTQLFWVPNHAFAGWLLIGSLYRANRSAQLHSLLPILFVSAALWSPLTAVGLAPFVAWILIDAVRRDHSLRLLLPQVWLPALIVGLAVATYLTLDPGQIPKGVMLGRGGGAAMSFLRQAQFFLLEAGVIGIAIIAIRPSSEVGLALAILAVLPAVYIGGGNDLVMRASIPSLAVLAIASCLALVEPIAVSAGGAVVAVRKKAILAGLLVVGAMTPVAELSRAVLLPTWPINSSATLIGANCGGFPPHYVARLGDETIGRRLMRTPNQLPLGPQDRGACFNPAIELMWGSHPL